MSKVFEVESREHFNTLLSTVDVVVVKFWATWCGPCRQLAPHYEKAAEKSDEMVFVAVDVDKAPWSMEDYGIRGVPTVMLFKDGEHVTNLQSRTAVSILNEIKSNV